MPAEDEILIPVENEIMNFFAHSFEVLFIDNIIVPDTRHCRNKCGNMLFRINECGKFFSNFIPLNPDKRYLRNPVMNRGQPRSLHIAHNKIRIKYCSNIFTHTQNYANPST